MADRLDRTGGNVLMLATDELTDVQWQIADAIARQLVIEGTDVNELRKAITYLRSVIHQEESSEKFFEYLKILAVQGQQIGHSKRTQGYHQSLYEVCGKSLKGRISEPNKLLLLLGWAARLSIYYKNSDLSQEDIQPKISIRNFQESKRQHEVRKAAQESSISTGQIVEAIITAIRGNRVTYEIFGAIKLTQREHKNINKLQLNQLVKVKIHKLRNDGVPKSVKLLE